MPIAKAANPGSAVFVTGSVVDAKGAGSYDRVVFHGATGARLWEARYSGPNPTSGGVHPAAIVVSPDGSKVFVTGGAPDATTTGSFATLAYAS